MSRYRLPDLPYDYGALEPHLEGHLMQLHHDKHHRAYVEGANKAIDELIEARERQAFDAIESLERRLAFNVSGHVLHSMFWQNLTPKGGGRPQGPLAEAIDRDFGAFNRMRQQLDRAGATIMGSGWAALVWDPVLKRLGTTQIHDHQSQVTQGSVLLMVMDCWEHAYYLEFETDKTRYFDALWKLWNWEDVSARFERAVAFDPLLVGASVEEAPVIELRH